MAQPLATCCRDAGNQSMGQARSVLVGLGNTEISLMELTPSLWHGGNCLSHAPDAQEKGFGWLW